MAINRSYVSDHTRFMNNLLEENPAWVEEQKSGRALWWDKQHDAREQGGFNAARVPQKAYVYFENFEK